MADSRDNRGPELAAVTCFFLGVSWLFVLLRCFVRAKITNSFQMDDWLMVCSVCIFTVYVAFYLVAIHYGFGRHNIFLTQDQQIQATKYTDLGIIMYLALMAFIKCSIAVFLLRIAVRPTYQWILKIGMFVVAVWSAATCLYSIFNCNPVAKQWDTTILDGTCVSADSIVASSYSYSAMSVISDWLFALLPIPMIWKVKMTIQTKITVGFILSLGVFASIATLIRLKYLIQIADPDDFLFQSIDAGIWTSVEIGLAIIAASVATLRPLLKALRVRGFSSDDSSARTGGLSNGGPYIRSHQLSSLAPNEPELVRRGQGKSTSAIETEAMSDNGSQEFILQGQIKVTRGVTIGRE